MPEHFLQVVYVVLMRHFPPLVAQKGDFAQLGSELGECQAARRCGLVHVAPGRLRHFCLLVSLSFCFFTVCTPAAPLVVVLLDDALEEAMDL